MDIDEFQKQYHLLKTSLRENVEGLFHLSVATQEKTKQLHDEKLHWAQLMSKIQENAMKANDMITLNIGGTLFMTTKATLLKMEGSYFHAMLASGVWLPNEMGHYFIDMDPKYFGRIMAYARSGDLSYAGLNSKEAAEFNEVVDYFQIRPTILDEVPCWDPEFCGSELKLQDNNRGVSKKALSLWNGVQSAQPCFKYSVQVVKGKNIVIGFAPRLGFRKNYYNHSSCGWFMSVVNGALYAQDGILNKDYGAAIPAGSVVTADHDTINHTIEFHVDGKSIGIAFRDIPHENLYAAADLSDENDEIRFVETRD